MGILDRLKSWGSPKEGVAAAQRDQIAQVVQAEPEAKPEMTEAEKRVVSEFEDREVRILVEGQWVMGSAALLANKHEVLVHYQIGGKSMKRSVGVDEFLGWQDQMNATETKMAS